MNMIDINYNSNDYINNDNQSSIDDTNNIGFTTIEPGKLKAAVTSICTDYTSPHQSCWSYGILNNFAKQNNLELELVKTPIFDGSWTLADKKEVDIVATGVGYNIAGRDIGNAQYSDPYATVKRGIRVNLSDAAQFQTLSDFVGHTIVVGKNMTSLFDLLNRNSENINIVKVDTWDEAYNAFYSHKADGIAEGFYYFTDEDEETNYNINLHTYDSTYIVDVHSLNDEVESLAFVVSNESENLLESLNAFIKTTGMPEKLPTFDKK